MKEIPISHNEVLRMIAEQEAHHARYGITPQPINVGDRRTFERTIEMIIKEDNSAQEA